MGQGQSQDLKNYYIIWYFLILSTDPCSPSRLTMTLKKSADLHLVAKCYFTYPKGYEMI